VCEVGEVTIAGGSVDDTIVINGGVGLVQASAHFLSRGQNNSPVGQMSW
jgi:hypothetical protein